MRILTTCQKVSRGMVHLVQTRCKHFSFLIDKNKIVSAGWNFSYKSHPLAAKYGHRFNSIHSELHCLTSHKKSKNNLIMVNIRLDDTGFKNSKPCIHCQKMLRDFNVTTIFYTTEIGWELLQL